MTLHIESGNAVIGNIEMPGDKSISHRAIILSAIFPYKMAIHHLLLSDDVLATIAAMRKLGVVIEQDETHCCVYGRGLQGLLPPQTSIDCGNSGTLMRLLMGLLSAQPFNAVLIGDHSLMQRPMSRVAEPLTLMGAKIKLSSQHTAPVEITGNPRLNAIQYDLPIPSAQVKSALLLAGLYANGKTNIIEKIKTRDHTEKMLAFLNEQPNEMYIPGDVSSAAFFMVLATITPHSRVVIRNVGVNPTRTGVIAILKKMGADINIIHERKSGDEPVADLIVKYAPLTGIDIPKEYVANAIDEFPAIFIAAACARGKTILHHAKELRVKESDRIAVMAANLKKLGVTVMEHDDGLTIEGGHGFFGGEVDAQDDHRIAMALAIAGHIAKKPIIIERADFIKTSFPNFVALGNFLNMKMSFQRPMDFL